MSEAMTYKLPTLPEQIFIPSGLGYTEDDMQAYAIAAIEAQGVQEPVYLVKSSIGASVWVQVSQAEYDEAICLGVVKRVLYTHPAPQTKPPTESRRNDHADR